jgi:hypothetical protein
MKVGDLVQDWLTERVGIITKIAYSELSNDPRMYRVQVLWTTQGLGESKSYLDMMGVREWARSGSLEVIA